MLDLLLRWISWKDFDIDCFIVCLVLLWADGKLLELADYRPLKLSEEMALTVHVGIELV